MSGWAIYDMGGWRHKKSVSPRRRRIWHEQGKLCCWCIRPVPISEASIEHLVPLSRGGSDRIENLAVACQRCNGLRGDSLASPTGKAMPGILERLGALLAGVQVEKTRPRCRTPMEPTPKKKERRSGLPPVRFVLHLVGGPKDGETLIQSSPVGEIDWQGARYVAERDADGRVIADEAKVVVLRHVEADKKQDS
jgi:hypothetical protein